MKRFIPILPWVGALLLIACALLYYETDLLWKVQQYNLFLDTPHFFHEQMAVSGGFLSYVGCYFTQFFFHPWLGVLILCGWWWLLMWLTRHTFRIADNWAVLALIPVAILLIADMSLGYWHYFMKLRGYFYVATIGTTVVVASLWVFRSLPNYWLRMVWIILSTAVGYPLFGIYGLAAVLLMAVWSWRLSANRSQNVILSVIALLCIIAVPLLCYRYVYYQTHINDIWTTALPTFLIIDSYPVYYTPYYILGAFFLLMVVLSGKSLPAQWENSRLRWSLQGVLAIALIAGVWHWWYKDANFHHELVMHHCIEQTDWEGVIQEGQKQGEEEPTRPMVMMYNLALQRLGRQLDEMHTFPEGKQKPNTPIPLNMTYHVYGHIFYYNYGLLNDSHRICMEQGVEFGWRIEYQEYLARCYLLSGEYQAARKILSNLRHTQFHGKWADAIQQLADNPKQIAEARETGPVTHMMYFNNSLGSDGGNVVLYIMTLLANEDSDDLYFQQQAVLAAIWLRNPKLFINRLRQYVRLLPQGAPIPRIFQEYEKAIVNHRPHTAPLCL